jgi:hemerythrin
MVRWTQNLATGDAEIDAQHVELFRRVNALHEAMQRGDRTEVGRLIAFLGRYVEAHFAAEDRAMAETAYPGFPSHRGAHARFVREYRAMSETFERVGPTVALTVQVKSWLVAWLEHHIAGSDVALARWLRERAAVLDRLDGAA